MHHLTECRCFKHHLNNTFRKNPEIKLCPAATIATLLNHVFGSEIVISAANESVTHVEVEDASKVVVDKKKKKKNKVVTDSIGVTPKEEAPSSAVVPECPNAAGNKDQCIQLLYSLAKTRFCMPKFALMFPLPAAVPVPLPVPDAAPDAAATTVADTATPATATTTTVAPATATAPGSESATAPDVSIEDNKPVKEPFLSDRISRITLLRRICQVRAHSSLYNNAFYSNNLNCYLLLH